MAWKGIQGRPPHGPRQYPPSQPIDHVPLNGLAHQDTSAIEDLVLGDAFLHQVVGIRALQLCHIHRHPHIEDVAKDGLEDL